MTGTRRVRAVGRIGAGVALLFGWLMIGRLALPTNVFACYCAPKPIASYVNDPEVVVVVGKVFEQGGAAGGLVENGTIEISHIFKGPVIAASMPIQGGSDAACFLPIRADRELLVVASIKNGTLAPSICWPSGDMATEEGRQLYADAVAAFGTGTATSVTDATPQEAAWVYALFVAAAVAVAAGMFAVVLLLVRRRRPG